MRKSIAYLLLLGLGCLTTCFAVEETVKAPIRVGLVKNYPPYTMQVNEQGEGFTLDVWRMIDKQNDFNSKYHWFSDSRDLHNALLDHKIDVAISPLILDELDHLRFKQTPILLIDEYQLVGRLQGVSGFWFELRGLFDNIQYSHVFTIALIIMLLANILIFFSRKPTKPRAYLGLLGSKILELFAWGVEGPKEEEHVKSKIHRIMIILWCLFFDVLLAGLVAAFSSALVVSRTQSIHPTVQLRAGMKIGIIRGHSLPERLLSLGVLPVEYPDGASAILDVKQGRLNYLVSTAENIKHLFAQDPDTKALGIFENRLLMAPIRFTMLRAYHNEQYDKITKALHQISSSHNDRLDICKKYRFRSDQACLVV